MQVGIGKESDVIFRFPCFCGFPFPPSPSHSAPDPPYQKREVFRLLPLCQILLAPGSSTHCRTWKESFFTIGKTGKRVLAPYKGEDEGIKMLLSQQNSLPSNYFAAKSPHEVETKKMVFVFLSLHSASNPNLHSPLHRSLCRYWHEVCIMCKNFLEERWNSSSYNSDRGDRNKWKSRMDEDTQW